MKEERSRINSMIGCSVFDGDTKVVKVKAIQFDYNILPQDLPMSKGELLTEEAVPFNPNKKYNIMVILRDVQKIETYQLTIKDTKISLKEPGTNAKHYCFESKTLEDWKVL